MASGKNVDHFMNSYGDLIFDLCKSVLQSDLYAQMAVRSILRKIRSASRFQKYTRYERSWVLRISCDSLISFAKQFHSEFIPEEQMKIDAEKDQNKRLGQFQYFFKRLRTEDQVLLLLKDKHHLPYEEISTALGTPVGSLKVRRQQALLNLDQWLWCGP